MGDVLREGFTVEPAALRGAANQISDSVTAISGQSFDASGFAGLDLGDADLQRTLVDFCLGVELAVDSLVQTCDIAEVALNDAARGYFSGDEDGEMAVRRAAGEVEGD